MQEQEAAAFGFTVQQGPGFADAYAAGALELTSGERREVLDVAAWRLFEPGLRTGPKTEAQQAWFAEHTVANPYSEHRYWAVRERQPTRRMVAFAGLTYLGRRSGEGEISLIVHPECRRRGVGAAAVDLLIEKAGALGLSRVVGEVLHDGQTDWWRRQVERREGTWVTFGGSMFFELYIP